MRSPEAFIGILIETLPEEQIQAILQAVTARITNGHCPLCEEEEVAVDREGNEIEGEDVSSAFEWQERHDPDCPVSLLEEQVQARQ